MLASKRPPDPGAALRAVRAQAENIVGDGAGFGGVPEVRITGGTGVLLAGPHERLRGCG